MQFHHCFSKSSHHYSQTNNLYFCPTLTEKMIRKSFFALKLTTIVKNILKKHSPHTFWPPKFNVSLLGSYPCLAKQKLPRPPVPDLELTMKKYLEYVKVIAKEEDYRQTEIYVEEFQKIDGPILQERLLKIAKEDNNWVNRYWLNDMYMNNRVALPINSNPGYVLPDRQFSSVEDMINFSAWFICGIYDYKSMIDKRSLPKDTATGKLGGQPLCMEQYWRLFTSYRHPAIPMDRQNTITNINLGSNEHIIVICNKQMFMINTVVDDNRLPQQNIAEQLKQVWNNCHKENSHSTGVLTTFHRDKAAEAVQILLQNSENRDSLKLIETSSFIFCLDKAINEMDECNGYNTTEDNLTRRAMQMLHGDGTEKHTCNRWYDKTMQFIVGENGACGMNYEHSVAEGIVVINLVEHALNYIDKNISKKLIGSPTINTKPKQLTWKIPQELFPKLDECKKEIDQLIKNMDFLVLLYDGYGRDFAKSKKVSPDVYIQLSLQWTYFRCHNHLVSTYESASIRRFREGRVDNIRSATPEALEWVKIMEDLSASNALKKQYFQKAVEKQTNVMVDNVTGYGIDNHLVALRELAKNSGKPLAKVFSDNMFQEVFRYPLSTSQVPTSIPRTFLCYGAVVDDGYGCGYNPSSNEILFTIASFKSCPKTNSAIFRETLRTTLDDMKEFLEN